jgi:RNAse (barnase) inhibitor barstar
LKRIFEDFKNALIQIYDSIKRLVYTENGEEYSFSEDDVANLEKLFERLLTTENERIKKTVFDKCDDINERIKDIKAHQEEEMKELDALWEGNIAAINRSSDIKRKVADYLALADKAVSRVPKEVKEMKKRYKDATLGILSVATGYKPQYIANSRNWERVEMALEHAGDKITTSGGMRAEWSEFYYDTGVSYENDEVDGGHKLAEQAFQTLVDGTYNFNNMNEDDIGEFYGKFDYLKARLAGQHM